MRRLKNSAVLAAILFLSFRYLADFSTSQSSVLAVVITLVIHVFLIRIEALRSATWDFQPFCVVVRPKLIELLRDYKLVNSDSELGRIAEMLDDEDTSTSNLFPHGFVFTVLKPDPGYIDFRGLIYRDDCKSFVSEVDFSSRMINRWLLRSNSPLLALTDNFRANSATLYMKWGIDGSYDLGLILDEELWEKLCVEAPHLKKIEN